MCGGDGAVCDGRPGGRDASPPAARMPVLSLLRLRSATPFVCAQDRLSMNGVEGAALPGRKGMGKAEVGSSTEWGGRSGGTHPCPKAARLPFVCLHSLLRCMRWPTIASTGERKNAALPLSSCPSHPTREKARLYRVPPSADSRAFLWRSENACRTAGSFLFSAPPAWGAGIPRPRSLSPVYPPFTPRLRLK